MTNAIDLFKPGLLGRGVFDDLFENYFIQDFPRKLRQSTRGYPIADIYSAIDGSTVMEFALAGFSRADLKIDIQPDKRIIVVSAQSDQEDGTENSRRIARRSFSKTYVNYDDNLDLEAAVAKFKDGLLTVTVPPRPEVKPVEIVIS
jgi:HSP20 family protein